MAQSPLGGSSGCREAPGAGSPAWLPLGESLTLREARISPQKLELGPMSLRAALSVGQRGRSPRDSFPLLRVRSALRVLIGVCGLQGSREPRQGKKSHRCFHSLVTGMKHSLLYLGNQPKQLAGDLCLCHQQKPPPPSGCITVFEAQTTICSITTLDGAPLLDHPRF